MPRAEKHPFLQGLSEPMRGELGSLLHRFWAPRGSLLYREGDHAGGVYWLESGWIKLHQETAGRERWVGLVGPGEFLGVQVLLDQEVRSESATLLHPGWLWRLSQEDWRDAVRRWPLLQERPARVLAQQLRQRLEEIEWFSLANSEERMAAYLYRLTRQAGTRLPFNQQMLATVARSSRETVGRSLRRLRRRGLIRQGPQGLEVPNPEALAEALRGLA